MADSNYYKTLYKEQKTKVKTYESNIADLQDVLDKMSLSLNDEIADVNTGIDQLKTDLWDSVRHNSLFNNSINQIIDKQKGTDADNYLKVVILDLQEEVSKLVEKKENAEYYRDYYEKKYNEKKEEERKEFLDSLLQGVKI